MLRSTFRAYSRCFLQNPVMRRHIMSEFHQRIIVPSAMFSQQGITEDEAKDTVPTTKTEDPKNFVQRNKIGGHMIRLTSTRKKFLALSGRWKNAHDIPDFLPEHQYNSDMWVVRIRIAAFIMVFWLLSCLCVASFGRKHVKERSHQVVMQQYLESLSPEEREKFAKEFNLKEK